MNDSITVVATLHPVPLEDGSGRIEPGAPARPVPNSLYYRRRIRSDELREVAEEAPAPEAPQAEVPQEGNPPATRSSRSRQAPAPATTTDQPPTLSSEEAAA